MSGFTTSALLYPLTKGDKAGHEFHGNQYREVGGEGDTTTTRPPIGHLQISKDEAQELVDIMKMSDNTREPLLARKATVELSKMLGMDKPAERVTKAPKSEPDLYRGCDKAGADSLSKPLETYVKAGAVYGEGVYFANAGDEDFNGLDAAKEYADRKDGQLVSAWIDPDAKILDLTTSDPPYLEDLQEQMYDKIDSLGLESHESPDLPGYQRGDTYTLKVFLSEPANIALALGYQGVKLYDQTVILDRSILKIAY